MSLHANPAPSPATVPAGGDEAGAGHPGNLPGALLELETLAQQELGQLRRQPPAGVDVPVPAMLIAWDLGLVDLP